MACKFQTKMEIDRRKVFTRLGLAGSAVALSGSNLGGAPFDSTKQRILEELEKLKQAYEQLDQEAIKAELEELKEAYQSLDSRTKWTLRILLALSGLDIFLSLE